MGHRRVRDRGERARARFRGLATSDDGFAKSAAFSANGAGPVSITVAGAKAAGRIRVYGHVAAATGGTSRIANTLTVDGALRCPRSPGRPTKPEALGQLQAPSWSTDVPADAAKQEFEYVWPSQPQAGLYKK